MLTSPPHNKVWRGSNHTALPCYSESSSGSNHTALPCHSESSSGSNHTALPCDPESSRVTEGSETRLIIWQEGLISDYSHSDILHTWQVWMTGLGVWSGYTVIRTSLCGGVSTGDKQRGCCASYISDGLDTWQKKQRGLSSNYTYFSYGVLSPRTKTIKSRLVMQYETQLNNNQNLKLLSSYLYVPTLYCLLCWL